MEVSQSQNRQIVNSNNIPKAAGIKFLCSYGGKILPRYPDGKLRYHGGETRVLSVDRSILFSDLMQKLREMCGLSVFLRCQLPKEDLDSLVSITTDEDLENMIEEYDFASSSSLASLSLKIRAFLFVHKPTKKATVMASNSRPPYSSASSSSSSSSSTSPHSCSTAPRFPTPMAKPIRCLHHQVMKSRMLKMRKTYGWKVPTQYYHNNGCGFYARVDHSNGLTYLIHNGKHQQQQPMF